MVEIIRKSNIHKETKIASINLGRIFLKILTNEFINLLPTSVKKLRTGKYDNSNHQRKKTRNKNSDRVVNEDMNKYLKLRTNENWDTVFRHKSVDGQISYLNCLPCLKYHYKGWRFKDCSKSSSNKNLSNKHKSETDGFFIR